MSRDATKIYRFGKFIAIEYPEVYFQFISKLNKEHPDLIRGMQLAQVNFRDGTALDFLNRILSLDPPVTNDTPMELGYAQLLDAINARSGSIITQNMVGERAAQAFSDMYAGYSRPEEDQGKPLFPSIEEMEDKGKKGN